MKLFKTNQSPLSEEDDAAAARLIAIAARSKAARRPDLFEDVPTAPESPQ